MERLRAVTQSDTQLKMRTAAVASAASANKVTPNRKLSRLPARYDSIASLVTSFGHYITLDIYQLQEHPNVGVVYFEQFEPPSDDIDANTYFTGISDTLFNGLNALKAAGVEKVILDISGNRGGYVAAGAIRWVCVDY